MQLNGPVSLLLALGLLNIVVVALFVFRKQPSAANTSSPGPPVHPKKEHFLTSQHLATYMLDKPTTYMFRNPTIAADMLDLLDVYQPVPLEYYNFHIQPLHYHHITVLGLKRDAAYCSKVRSYFAAHSDSVMTHKYFFSDHMPDALPRRKVISTIGIDITLNVNHENKEEPGYYLEPTINSFYTVYSITRISRAWSGVWLPLSDLQPYPRHRSTDSEGSHCPDQQELYQTVRRQTSVSEHHQTFPSELVAVSEGTVR